MLLVTRAGRLRERSQGGLRLYLDIYQANHAVSVTWRTTTIELNVSYVVRRRTFILKVRRTNHTTTVAVLSYVYW